ncbi:hypothetical protein BGX31_007042, partial [Mortierella sp. GBA43]
MAATSVSFKPFQGAWFSRSTNQPLEEVIPEVQGKQLNILHNVMEGSRGSNDLNKEAWKDEIDAARDGAG